MAATEQRHPLHAKDRPVVDRLLQQQAPTDQDVVDVARLLQRYRNFHGAFDIQRDLEAVLAAWKLNYLELLQRSRAIWASGFHPASLAGREQIQVGSGFDSQETSSLTP